DIQKLIENIRNNSASLADQRQQLDLVRRLNEQHWEQRQRDARLEARIQSFELAFRMQTEAAEIFDIRHEPQAVRDWYGPGVQGRHLVIRGRLLERGVRFVKVWSGGSKPWDNHDGIEKAHRDLAKGWDQPIAAFLKDLKQRGMLDSTLVIWGGE